MEKPLLPEDSEQCGEKGREEAEVQEALGDHYDRCGPSLWGCLPCNSYPSHVLDEDREERLCRIRLEFGLDLDDKGGTDGRTKTRLDIESRNGVQMNKMATHKNQGRIQVIPIFSLEFLVKLVRQCLVSGPECGLLVVGLGLRFNDLDRPAQS